MSAFRALRRGLWGFGGSGKVLGSGFKDLRVLEIHGLGIRVYKFRVRV